MPAKTVITSTLYKQFTNVRLCITWRETRMSTV